MSAVIALRLDCAWGGGCLWPANEAARAAIASLPADDHLGLPDSLRAELVRMARWHDTALDWDDPGGPLRWDGRETARFDAAMLALRDRIAAALGPAYSVTCQTGRGDDAAMLDARGEAGQSTNC